MIEGFRGRILAGEILLGPMVQVGSPTVVEILGTAGADFVVLDTEHGQFDLDGLVDLIRAADAAGVASMVKLREADPGVIGKVLDLGANGVVVADVSMPEQAAAIVKACKYRPLGGRGAAPMVRAAGYSAMAWSEYSAQANAETTVWVKVEGKAAIQQAGAIASVPGVDVVSIGPYDLSQALGIAGQFDHPDLVACIEQIVTAVREAKGAVGSFAPDAGFVHRWRDLGVMVFNLSADVTILFDGMRTLVQAARNR